MSLTEEEIAWDTKVANLCERMAVPNGECFCAYHEYPPHITKRDATREEMEMIGRL